MNPRKFLTDRADSYGRDARVLREDGDLPMAVAYETIRDELRRAADELAPPCVDCAGTGVHNLDEGPDGGRKCVTCGGSGIELSP